jgi:hypothetical protein
MRALARLLVWMSGWVSRLGVCAIAGIVVGMLTGGAVELLSWLDAPLAPSPAEFLRLWLITALFGWLVLLFVLVALSRWSFASVALPALINALLTSGLTLLLCRWTGLWAWAFWLGILAGLIVGLILCFLGRLLKRG